MNINWTSIVIAVVGAAGFWAVLKTVVDKQKTAYDMLIAVIAELKELYTKQSTEFEREKLDSAEKSSVIAQTHKCKHRFNDPDIVCPVDDANADRLKNRCVRCQYNPDIDDQK